MSMNVSDLLPGVERVVREAGSILWDQYGDPQDVSRKADNSFVTAGDKESEACLVAGLKAVLPEASVLAEESGQSGSQGAYQWVIDPLDGSTNFVIGLPFFSISVALTYENKPILGMVYQPVADLMFHAVKGGGAFCNGLQLQISSISLDAAVVSYGVSRRDPHLGKDLTWLDKVSDTVYTTRKIGSMALELGYIAADMLHGGVFAGFGWWDVAAGSLLVSEAGGVVTQADGKPLERTSGTCVVGSKVVHKALVGQLSGFFA